MHEVTECKHPLKVQSKPVISTVHSHTPHQQISVLDNVLWTPSCWFLTHRALWDISDEVFSVCCVLKSHSFLWYRLSHWIQSLANSERNLVHISITFSSVMTSLWRRTHTGQKALRHVMSRHIFKIQTHCFERWRCLAPRTYTHLKQCVWILKTWHDATRSCTYRLVCDRLQRDVMTEL